MSRVADLLAYGPEGQIALIVEVKSRTETSRAWATQMRRNMLAHGIIPDSQFLLLALPDRLYLWKNAGNEPELVEPSYEIDATPIFKPYYEKARLSPATISNQSFELIVASWLNELIQSGISAELPEEQKKLLQDSGLFEALKHGNIAVKMMR
jgi:hypothetical protein